MARTLCKSSWACFCFARMSASSCFVLCSKVSSPSRRPARRSCSPFRLAPACSRAEESSCSFCSSSASWAVISARRVFICCCMALWRAWEVRTFCMRLKRSMICALCALSSSSSFCALSVAAAWAALRASSASRACESSFSASLRPPSLWVMVASMSRRRARRLPSSPDRRSSASSPLRRRFSTAVSASRAWCSASFWPSSASCARLRPRCNSSCRCSPATRFSVSSASVRSASFTASLTCKSACSAALSFSVSRPWRSRNRRTSSSLSVSVRARYSRAISACFFSGVRWLSSSSSTSITRTRFSSARLRRPSASSLRERKRLMPAASSKTARRSSLRWLKISSMRPWPMME